MWPVFLILAGLWALLAARRAGTPSDSPIAPGGGSGDVEPPDPGQPPPPPPPPDTGGQPPPPPSSPVEPDPAFWSIVTGNVGGASYPDMCADGMAVWSDVVKGDGTAGTVHFAYGTGHSLITTPGEWMFLRAVVTAHGYHVAVGKSHGTGLCEVCCLESGRTVQLQPITHGNWCVALVALTDGTVKVIWSAWINGTTNGVAQVFSAPDLIPQYQPNVGDGVFFPWGGDPGSSTGFDGIELDASGNDIVYFRSPGRRATVGGISLAGPPQKTDTWIVGQADSAGLAEGLIAARLDGSKIGTVYQGPAFDPNIRAVRGEPGHAWIAARTLREGAFFARVPAVPALVRTDGGGIQGGGGSVEGTIPEVPLINKPCVLGAYLFSGGGLPADVRDGSCVNAVIYDPYLRRLDTRAPIAAMIDTEWDHNQGKTLAQSIEDASGESGARVFYTAWTDIPDELLDGLRSGDIVSFPVYRNPGETLKSLDTRGLNAIDRISSRGLRALIVMGLFTRQDSLTTQQVIDCAPVYWHLLQHAAVVGGNWFGINRADGTGRPDGTGTQRPALWELVKRFRSIGLPDLAVSGGGGNNDDGGGGDQPDDWGTPVDWPVWSSAGVVNVDNGVLRDDRSVGIQIGTTLFPALWMYRHDRDRLRANLAYLRDQKVNYIRALGVVGGNSTWDDRQCNPRWPDYDQVLDGCQDLAAEHGVRIEWSIFGGIELTPTPNDRQRLIERFVALAQRAGGSIEHFEIANEIQNRRESDTPLDRDEARFLAGILRRNTPNGIALSSVSYDVLEYWYRNSAANILTFHLDRDVSGTGGYWRPIRQAWEIQFVNGIPRCWSSNEPIGPKSSVNADADPVRIGISPAYAQICGFGAYVFHPGAGVFMGGAAGESRQREHNLWEVQNAGEIFAMFRSIRSILPGDLANWNRHNGHWPSNPIAIDVSAFDDGRVLRTPAATSGDQFVWLPLRIMGDVACSARANMTVSFYNPQTADLIEEFDLMNGQGFTLRPMGARADDGGHTVIVRGVLR
jgi:hypothetical protein